MKVNSTRCQRPSQDLVYNPLHFNAVIIKSETSGAELANLSCFNLYDTVGISPPPSPSLQSGIKLHSLTTFEVYLPCSTCINSAEVSGQYKDMHSSFSCYYCDVSCVIAQQVLNVIWWFLSYTYLNQLWSIHRNV